MSRQNELVDPCVRTDRGQEGEERAVEYLQGLGYILRERNFRTKLGEIDAIFEKDGEIVFVEVKVRNGRQIASPEEAITAGKQKRLIRTALWYIKLKRLAKSRFRFDVVIIDDNGPRQIENAFSSVRRYTF